MKALPVEPSNVPVAIGSRIRAARQSQRLTIEQVADATGLTKGFLSRVERDLTSPSVASLVTLCQVLSISIGDLFAAPETHLTKQDEGPRISLGGEGIVERLLTARSERRVQIIQAVIEPRGRGESELYAVDCDVDVLHVVKGSIRLILTNEEFELSAGDTVTFPGREPHTWVNPTDDAVEVLWVLVPAASRIPRAASAAGRAGAGPGRRLRWAGRAGLGRCAPSQLLSRRGLRAGARSRNLAGGPRVPGATGQERHGIRERHGMLCGVRLSTARISAMTRSGSNQMCSGMYLSTANPLTVEALLRPRSTRMASRLEWNAYRPPPRSGIPQSGSRPGRFPGAGLGCRNRFRAW